MTDAISAAKLAMMADLERLTALGQNLSNVSTVGYRRQIPVSLEFSALLSGTDGGLGGYSDIPLTGSVTDGAVGALASTGRSLDLAIEGEGFFSVLTDAGVRYARRGDLQLDGSGQLVTAGGAPVLTDSGPIRLTSSQQVTINAQGEIHAGGDLLGRLSIAEFGDPNALVYEGDGLFQAEGATPSSSPMRSRVRQGFLENSNVDPMRETVQLLESSRHFALTRHAITAYDQMLDSAINTLAQF